MSISPDNRRLLSLEPKGYARGNRHPLTCTLRCGDACDKPVANTTDTGYFRDIATAALSRRAVLGGAAAGAVAVGAATAVPAAAAPNDQDPRFGSWGQKAIDWFTPIAPVKNDVDDFTTPEGFYWHPIIAWGDPILADAPEFNPWEQTAEKQAGQFGYNNDYLDIIPLDKSGKRAVLVANHEYTNEYIMFPDYVHEHEVRKIAMAAHGFSVVELRREGKGERWEYQRGAYLNRRFTTKTPFEMTGPAAGSDLLKTKDDASGKTVLGTLNNCAGSTTPWGTILSGEENFNQYFVANESPETDRYGIGGNPEDNQRQWFKVDPRFDARKSGYENEVNRFGWVVEIDPMDPTSTPRKHTSLGRFKHEAAAVRLSYGGKAVAYSGDDSRFEYLYKFISHERMMHGTFQQAKDHNRELLSNGDLFVAKFDGDSPESEIDGTGTLPSDGEFDGKGRWIQLTKNGESMVEDMTIDEVLVYTRLAADKVGATMMDRPEDVQPNPVNGRVYIACTNNTKRGKEGKPGVDEANPRIINREGHVVELMEDGGNAESMTFSWRLFLVCGDPAGEAKTYFGGYTGEVSPISCPDNVAFDSVGNLWISTDGQPGTIGYNDALHRVHIRGSLRGRVEQFLAVPREAETCGPVVHDKEKTVYVAVQHPGEGGTWEEPTSKFPNYDQGVCGWHGPRPAVVQVSPSVDCPPGQFGTK